MEGSWRGLACRLAAAAIVCVSTAGTVGCGGDESDATKPDAAVQTASPERTFAPLIEVAADEPWRPTSARWFIERSLFGFAEDGGCADREIAVGHTMAERRTKDLNWIYPTGLGDSTEEGNYFRNPYGADCELEFGETFYADQLTRPYDPGVRVEGVRPGEGFYLDLADDARAGLPPPRAKTAPIYVERADEGDERVRLTYWVLFGMHGQPGAPNAHEGDWERIDVLLRAVGGDGYEPLALQTPPAGADLAAPGEGDDGARARETAWDATRRVDGTHPVVTAARSTHAMAAGSRGAGCADCLKLRSWRSLAPAPEQPWYGFGGAWGEPGPTEAATGPLGPHGEFATIADKQREPRG